MVRPMILVAALVCAALADYPPPAFPFEKMTRLTVMAAYLKKNESGSFRMTLDESNYSAANFDTILPCARQKNPSIELVVTLGKDVPMWREAAENMDQVGPLLVQFLEERGANGYNFDWEDKVDTEFYISFLQKIRTALDASGKKYLITVAPGWPQYKWDKRAKGVVDTFDCMSYQNYLCEVDLAGRVTRFELEYGLPKTMLLGGVECEPHWNGSPGWNPDECIVSKVNYAVKNGLQGMFSFRLDNDHGPWPKSPAEPTYHGHQVMYDAAKKAGAQPGFVLNSYMSLYDFHPPEQIGCTSPSAVV